MLDVRMIVRDILSQRLWKISDSIDKSAGRMRNEEQMIVRNVMEFLPTPSNLAYQAQNYISRLAHFVAPPNCAECDCSPCMCAYERNRNRYKEACKTWLTEEMVDKLMSYEPPGAEGLSFWQMIFRTKPTTESAWDYLSAGYDKYITTNDFDALENAYNEVKDFIDEG